MIRLNVHDAKTHLSRYLNRLKPGETIILCKRNLPIAELRRLPKTQVKGRPVGLAKGELRIPKSFYEPLPPSVLSSFLGQK